MEALPTVKITMAWAGFGLAAISSAFSIFAIIIWTYTADMLRDMEGSAVFSLNIVPLLATWAGIAIFPFAATCTTFSVCVPLQGRRRSFTIFHGFSVALLAPAAYLLFRMPFR
jgi:hypothetical protein